LVQVPPAPNADKKRFRKLSIGHTGESEVGRIPETQPQSAI
jgi:hypothetical protein